MVLLFVFEGDDDDDVDAEVLEGDDDVDVDNNERCSWIEFKCDRNKNTSSRLKCIPIRNAKRSISVVRNG